MPRMVLAVILVAGCHRGPKPPDGDIAATLTVAPIGAPFDPASLRGKPSLVLFVTPTCPHCLATLPRAAIAAKAKDANLVAVFVAGGADRARTVVGNLHFPGTVLVDDGTLTRRYHVDYVPYSLVLGADGHAKAALEGEQDEPELEAALGE